MAPVTAEQVAAEYLAGAPAKSRRSYRSFLQQWFTWCARQGVDVLDVRRVHIEVWAAGLAEVNHYAAATVNSRLTPVLGLYTYAVDEGYLAANPGARVRRPPWVRESTGAHLQADQLRALLRAADQEEPDARALVWLLATHGLRLGELLAVDICDVRPGPPVTLSLLRKRRDHPIQLRVADAALEPLTALTNRRHTGPLLRRNGRRMQQHHALAVVTTLAARAGITERITPHALRRTFVSLGRDAGISDRDLMAATGHTGAEMLNYYDRGRDSAQRDAGDQLHAWLARPLDQQPTNDEAPPPPA